MSFSYLYILQRQWIRDVNSIFNPVKTWSYLKRCALSPVRADRFAVQFVLPTQLCKLCEAFPPRRNHWPRKHAVFDLENQHPCSTNNMHPLLVWSVTLKEKRGEANKVEHLPLFVRNCTGRKTTEQHLDKIAQEWISFPLLIRKPVNTIFFFYYYFIKHCAKVLKNKRYYKMEHLNIWTFPMSFWKAPENKSRGKKETLCTVKQLNIHTGVSGLCVCVCVCENQVDNCI